MDTHAHADWNGGEVAVDSEQIVEREAPSGLRAVEEASVYLSTFGWNQDSSCFCAATTSDFRTFSVEPLAEVHRRSFAESSTGVLLAVMLFQTNIFALVLAHDPRKVVLWDDYQKKKIQTLRSFYDVKNVALRRDVIVVVSEYRVYLYSTQTLKVIRQLETTSNPRGLCGLVPRSDRWILCCPGQAAGAVRVQFDGDDSADAVVFAAHQSPLAAIATDEMGTLVATASEHGTVVKVFRTQDGSLLQDFRRGANPAAISSLTFRADGAYLAVASSSPTVHVFRIQKDGESQEWTANTGLSLTGAVSSIAESAGVMNDVVKGLVQGARASAVFRIPDVDAHGLPTLDLRSRDSPLVGPKVAFAPDSRLLVLHFNGFMYECRFDESQDGSHQECQFLGASTWFASRPDFAMQVPCDAEGDEWQLL
jgi:WD40 repeat protein